MSEQTSFRPPCGQITPSLPWTQAWARGGYATNRTCCPVVVSPAASPPAQTSAALAVVSAAAMGWWSVLGFGRCGGVGRCWGIHFSRGLRVGPRRNVGVVYGFGPTPRHAALWPLPPRPLRRRIRSARASARACATAAHVRQGLLPGVVWLTALLTHHWTMTIAMAIRFV
jgi:hypothetical protein